MEICWRMSGGPCGAISALYQPLWLLHHVLVQQPEEDEPNQGASFCRKKENNSRLGNISSCCSS